jgi:hypothetical protein
LTADTFFGGHLSFKQIFNFSSSLFREHRHHQSARRLIIRRETYGKVAGEEEELRLWRKKESIISNESKKREGCHSCF